MVIGIFGENCTGKSALADKLKEHLDAEIYTGRDYLRLEKNEAAAKRAFQAKICEAVKGSHIIYVISEKEHLPLLPDGSVRILVTADLDAIKTRFAQRMNGRLPEPIAAMLEKKHGCFDMCPHNIHVVSGQTNIDAVCREIAALES